MEWRNVSGFEGYYEVNECGDVRSLDRYSCNSNGVIRYLHGVNMKKTIAPNGYYVVNLHKDGKSFVMPVHRIVATSFLDNSYMLPTINHIDGNKLNNNVSNLEWASYSRNNVHALTAGLRKPRGYAVKQFTMNGLFVAEYDSACEASRITGINRSMISHCVNGREPQAGGYVWIKSKECNDYLREESTSEDELLMEVQEPLFAEDIVCSDRNI